MYALHIHREELSDSNSKGWLELGLIKHLNKSTVILYRSDKTKERDLELLKAARCLKVNI